MLFRITEKIIRGIAFEQKKKKPQKYNPGLCVNRPSNNWAQIFKIGQHQLITENKTVKAN